MRLVSFLGVMLACVMACACGTTPTPTPIDPGQLSKPLARLMVPPEPQIDIPPPECEGDPACRAAEYYAPHRNQCGGFRDNQIGLQAYVTSLHSGAPGNWAPEVKR